METTYSATSVAQLEVLAQSHNLTDKRHLYDIINKEYFGGEAPFERITLKKFDESSVERLKSILQSKPVEGNVIWNLKKIGIGRGEIALAYLVENLCIGGLSVDIDLTLFDSEDSQWGTFNILDQAELKECKVTKDGYAKSWRTAAKHRPFVERAKTDLEALYHGLREDIPELDINTPYGRDAAEKAARGEYAAVLKHIKHIENAQTTIPSKFQIAKVGSKLMVTSADGTKIGDLKNPDVLAKVEAMVSCDSTVVLKNYKQIEAELCEGFESVKEKFIFMQSRDARKGDPKGTTRFIDAFYKENLIADECRMEEVSAGTVKVGVKVK